VARVFHTWDEIQSQPETWRSTLAEFAQQRAALDGYLAERGFDRVLAIGCGSTHYLAQTAATMISRYAGVPAAALPSSEVWLSPEAIPAGPALLVAISRSGTTTETLRAVERFREVNGGSVLAVSCYPESELVQAADFALLAPAAQEQSIAQTRSFSSMVLLTQALCGVLARDEAFVASLAALPDALTALVERFTDIPSRLGSDLALERFYFLGGGVLYGQASEAMLKLKEMTLTHAEAYHPLEFRHGPMSMINDQSLVVGLVAEPGAVETVRVLRDMQKLGAHVLVLAEDGSVCEPLQAMGDSVDLIELRSGLNEVARTPLYMPPLQHLAYHRAVAKGFDPDHPHNLTAVVSL
jgi:glutamine---fructose-6-phosphate transaminase (isomerizing)